MECWHSIEYNCHHRIITESKYLQAVCLDLNKRLLNVWQREDLVFLVKECRVPCVQRDYPLQHFSVQAELHECACLHHQWAAMRGFQGCACSLNYYRMYKILVHIRRPSCCICILHVAIGGRHLLACNPCWRLSLPDEKRIFLLLQVHSLPLFLRCQGMVCYQCKPSASAMPKQRGPQHAQIQLHFQSVR